MSWIFVKQNAVPWTPEASASLAAWYDPSSGMFDATSGGNPISASGTSVKRWEPRAGFLANLTTAGTGIVSTTLNGVLALRGTNSTDYAPLAWYAGAQTAVQSYTLAVVYQANSFATQGHNYQHVSQIRWRRTDGYDPAGSAFEIRGTSTPPPLRLDDGQPGYTQYNGANAAYWTDTPRIMVFQASPTAFNGSSRNRWRIDGSTVAGTVGSDFSSWKWSGLYLPTTTNTYKWGAGSRFGDAIVLTGVGLEDAEKVEGYLAHKYALTANLPAGHPYKSAAPTV